MKCPMLTMYAATSDYPESYQDRDCLKEECAWWDSTNNNCAVLQLSKSIYYAGTHIAQMEIKMPHEGQFRK